MKLLLQVCCAPCMLGCLDRVIDDYEVTVLYYNPNTYPESEYEKRLVEVEKVLSLMYPDVKLIVSPYDHSEFLSKIGGFETSIEGGSRCEICMNLRLTATAKMAGEMGFDYFDSTLSVSPHKNFAIIEKLGKKLETEYNVKYLASNFKKKDGFLLSTKRSKELGIYRQEYCGCEFSVRNEE